MLFIFSKKKRKHYNKVEKQMLGWKINITPITGKGLITLTAND